MLIPMILAAAAALTPAQSKRADAVAVAWLTQACVDGRERAGVVSAADGVFHDLTAASEAESVDVAVERIKPFCTSAAFIFYHCHPGSDPFSQFPGVGSGSDFGSAAQTEYLCGLEALGQGVPVAQIEHRIVHTGGSGAVVGYALRGEPLEQVRSLARRMHELQPRGMRVGHLGLPDVGDLPSLPRRMAMVHAELAGLYERITDDYTKRVIGYVRGACPSAETPRELLACPNYTVQGFAGTLDPCGSYEVVPPGGMPRPCTAPVGERVTLGPRYEGWTELNPATYDAFTSAGRVALALCDDSGRGTAPSCGVMLRELDERLPQCRELKRGFVDTARYAALRERHGISPLQNATLLEDGRPYFISVPDLSAQLYRAVICGAQTLFGQ